MYADYFGLQQEPFSIAPDPRFLYLSARHREALAHLLYGLDRGGGFVLLTGEVGAGKTTACRAFLKHVPPTCHVAYILNPMCSGHEMLKSVCAEFGVTPSTDAPSSQDCIDALNAFLLRTHAEGQQCLLIVDEAQNLSPAVLEQLRLLTNLETDERKLLQILLIGQPELRDMLARPEMKQLAQRVIARYHLGPLNEAETEQYIRHRLAVAGRRGTVPIRREARARIHRLSGGIPRRINLLCDRALLAAYGDGKPRVDVALIDSAAREVFVERQRAGVRRYRRAAVWACGLAASAALAGMAAVTPTGGLAPAMAEASAVAPSPAPAPVPAAASAVSLAAPAVAAVTPVPASAVSAASAPSVLEQPIADERQAWRELAGVWNLRIDGEQPCRAVQTQQVRCFAARMDLGLIRQLDRPGILALQKDDGAPTFALLVGLTADSAVLQSGGRRERVPLLALTRHWQGYYATYWRVPPSYTETLTEGSTGPMVDRIAAQLARLEGAPAPQGRQVFDAAMRERVHAFQLAQGLKPDGLAGPYTLMQLNRATGIDEPHLQRGG
nr:AAA family ATPase [uncultured Caldimonas sp.]